MENLYVRLGIRKTKQKRGGFKNMDNQEEWCHYSDLPSPMAYVNNTDNEDK